MKGDVPPLILISAVDGAEWSASKLARPLYTRESVPGTR